MARTLIRFGMVCLCMALVVSLVPAAGQRDAAARPDERFEFDFMTWEVPAVRDAVWFEPLQEAANVRINLIDGGDRSVYYQNIDLRLASRDIPDTLVVDMTQADLYGPQGAFVDWAPHIDQIGPNIRQFADDNPMFEALVTTDAGNIFAVPFEQPAVPWVVAMYREDVFDELGLSLPTDTDELLEVLRQLKAANPDPGFYPISAVNLGLFIVGFFQDAFGAEAQTPGPDGALTGHYAEWGGGQDLLAPGYRDMIEYLKVLYEEGLADPEMIHDAHNEEVWGAKMINGDSVITAHHYSRTARFTTAGRELDPDFLMSPMVPLQRPDGSRRYYMAPRFALTWSTAIGSPTRDPASIVRFYDYLFSDEGNAFLNWGIEGRSYEWVDGERRYIISWDDVMYPRDDGQMWSLIQTQFRFAAPADHEAAAALESDPFPWVPEFQQYLYSPKQLKVPGEDLVRISEIAPRLNEEIAAGRIAFITGDRPMNEWDSFVQSIIDLGYKEVTAINQRWFDKLYAR